MSDTAYYANPLIERYASREMSAIFSDDHKFTTWRKLWIALAESEKELGIDITDEQIEEMKAHVSDINYDVAKAREKEVRHDVMSHVYAYGVQCPKAKPIIHLGATSCYVGCNTDVINVYEALQLIKSKLVNVMYRLKCFAKTYKSLPTLGFTHLQPAQLVTVGKRATLWLQDLAMDYYHLTSLIDSVKLRGVKGTTGTQASFLELFNGDGEKVKELEKKVVEKLGFKSVYGVTGQTYPRKFDYNVLSVLSMIAQSAFKFSTDIRILQNMKEIEEPFAKKQIGSSAMAYKRNPMRSERIGSLARYVITLTDSAAITSSTQWFERTLDDSACRRITIPQAFLALDAVLNIYMNVTDGLVVYDKVIRRHVDAELPFMATEMILMQCVKCGGDRQELHERIRVHSMEAGRVVKEEGGENDLIERIKADEAFKPVWDTIDSVMQPENFIGRAPSQVDEFISEEIDPILEENKHCIKEYNEVNV